jgi:hypothetical protein
MSAQDSGGYDNNEIEVKLQKAVEGMAKHIGENMKLTKNQVVQLRKTISQHEKKYKTDKDHWRWKDQDRQKQRKFALEKIEFQGKQVRLNKQLANAMKQNIESYNYVKQSLTGGGRSLRSATMGVVDSLYMLTKHNKDLKKAEKELADAKKSGKGVDAAQDIVDQIKNNIKMLQGNNRVIKSIVSKLDGLGKIMEKHQGKIMIGAGLASVIIGIITKALSVAPLFQAMMKLMQFAVTMILMPIGTFFGAVLRPIVIGLVKGIAPQFKDWMKTAMKLGNDLGKFIMEFLKNPAAALGGIFKNAILGDTSAQMGTVTTLAGAGAATAVATKILPKVLTTATKPLTLGVSPLAGTNAAKLGKTGWSLSNLLKGSLGIGKIGAVGAGMGGGLSSILTGGKTSEKAAEIATRGLAKVIPKVLTTSIPLGIKLGFKAIPVLGWATLAADVAGSAMKQWAPDQYESVRQGALGIGSFLGDTEGTHTEGLLDILGFGKQSTAEMLGEGFKELQEMFKGGSAETIAQSAEKSAGFIETLEEAATKMGTQSAPTMDSQMTEIMNHFIRMKGYGLTSQKAMENTAENFAHADATITQKLSKWVRAAKAMESKAPLQKALTAQREYKTGQGTNDSLFGGSNYVNPWTKSNQGTTVKVDLGDGTFIEDGVRKFDYTAADRSGRTMSSNEVANQEVRDKIATSAYAAGAAHADGIDGKHESQISRLHQLLPHLIPNYAGGQINEPVFGIGRSGRTYSFGEHGSETVTPNGGTGGGITINIAKIEKNADFEQLKPMIQRWILEANSRRGMI